MTDARGAVFRHASRALKMGAPEIPRGRFTAKRSDLAIRETRPGPPGRPGKVDFWRPGPNGRAGLGWVGMVQDGPGCTFYSNRDPIGPRGIKFEPNHSA